MRIERQKYPTSDLAVYNFLADEQHLNINVVTTTEMQDYIKGITGHEMSKDIVNSEFHWHHFSRPSPIQVRIQIERDRPQTRIIEEQFIHLFVGTSEQSPEDPLITAEQTILVTKHQKLANDTEQEIHTRTLGTASLAEVDKQGPRILCLRCLNNDRVQTIALSLKPSELKTPTPVTLADNVVSVLGNAPFPIPVLVSSRMLGITNAQRMIKIFEPGEPMGMYTGQLAQYGFYFESTNPWFPLRRGTHILTFQPRSNQPARWQLRVPQNIGPRGCSPFRERGGFRR